MSTQSLLSTGRLDLSRYSTVTVEAVSLMTALPFAKKLEVALTVSVLVSTGSSPVVSSSMAEPSTACAEPEMLPEAKEPVSVCF